MKLNSLSVLCLSLLLIHTHFSLAKRGGGGFGKISFGKIFGSGSKKTSTFSQSSGGAVKTRPKSATKQGSISQSTYPRQPSGGVYHDQYSVLGSPNRGNYGGFGGQGGYGKHGGGYMNYNPKNRVLSPRFGGRFGYGGYGARGGSPYSQAVQEMGVMPSEKSRKHGRKAMLAVAGGAMAGMALGYGLGRFPRPHFDFHSPQEEYYYNYYMYRKYGVKSTDTNDYSRDYAYSKPPQSYDNYMDRCMKRTDLLPGENQQPNNKSATNTRNTTAAATSAHGTGSNATKTNSTAKGGNTTMTDSAAVDSDATKTNNTAANSNATKTNSAAADKSSTSTPSTKPPLNEPQANPVPPAPQDLPKTATDDDDDDTVSIVEIGYPSLINQLKVRRCLELYMVYSDKYLEKKVQPRANSGVKQETGSGGLLAVVTSTILMLLNSNMLMLLH